MKRKMNKNKNTENFLYPISLMKNKHGWLEIVEAFVAVLLVAGVLLIILNKGYLQRTDISNQVYNAQISIIKEIQTDDSLRKDITGTSAPTEWENVPQSVRDKIILRTPSYLNCIGKICCVEDDASCPNKICDLAGESLKKSGGKDIYSQSGVISPTIGGEEVYRKLNLFCWAK